MKKQLVLAASALLLTASMAQAQLVVRIGPPRPHYERVPPPPHPGWAWRAGYQRWDGAHYVWTPGEYVAPPRAGVHWVQGHWAHRRGGWVWIEGHWV
jgi:hypothetical protein